METLTDIFVKIQPEDPKNLQAAQEKLDPLSPEKRKNTVDHLRKLLTLKQTDEGSLRIAKHLFGEQPLLARILITDHFGTPKFTIRFLPENQEPEGLYISPAEGEKLIEQNQATRPCYAQRLKSAYLYLIANKENFRPTEFRYSTDGEHFTKGYPDESRSPEPTISHEEARKIVEASNTKPTTLQTKTYKLYPEPKLLALRKINGAHEGKALYRWETHPASSEDALRQEREFKIIWPYKQRTKLDQLLRTCKSLIIEKSAESLGGDDAGFAVLFEKDLGKTIIVKALITQAKNKGEANKKAQAQLSELWPNQTKEEDTTTSTLTCLTKGECGLLLQLLQRQATGQTTR